jgi:nucleotide-binding universal stress UspA family protein
MFEKVLVALDFSAYSQKILDCITGIPGIREVVLMHVVDATRPSKMGWTHGAHIENTRIIMAEKKEALEHLGFKVRISVEVIVDVITQGSVPLAILEAAETNNATLIVMGARGINPIRELLLGSVSSSVVRHAKTSVLILHPGPGPGDHETSVRPPGRMLFSTVLVPTDFSPPAGSAFAFVKTIPEIKEIVLLHVVTRAESQEEIEAGVQEAQMKLEEMKHVLEPSGISVTVHVRVGDPTEMILSVADEDDIPLIAMSASGRDWIHNLLIGSTAFTVVRRAQRPVLVIRTGRENATH